MNKECQKHWLERRLNELGKTKKGFAECLGIRQPHVSAILSNIRKIQAEEIKKTAEFLEFDRTAFLDFISGDITEGELWNYQTPETVSAEDMALLKAVKSLASRQETPQDVKDHQKSAAIPSKSKERN